MKTKNYSNVKYIFNYLCCGVKCPECGGETHYTKIREKVFIECTECRFIRKSMKQDISFKVYK
jgi:hypothetical protein